MTTEQLRSAEVAYRAASRRSQALRDQRDQLIHNALQAGWTHAAIAKTTGLSRGRINQIRAAA